MRLKSIILENFRCYDQRILIPIENNLTALIGKNDAGKSTVLEALEIFFNNQTVKIQPDDSSVSTKEEEVLIGCVFDDLPTSITVDTSSITSLAAEHLLNDDGDLEIHRRYNCALKTPKDTVYAYAIHPTNSQVDNLLQLKNSALKSLFQELKISQKVDMRSNAALRAAIWQNFSAEELRFAPSSLRLDKEDAKRIWVCLCKYLPVYALFKSDRSSTDDDSEVQDPMKLAVEEAIRTVQAELEKIKREVQLKATEVAQKTLDKLNEMDPSLASDLSPNFKAEPRWSSLFKLSLTGDDQIPINKRGSGVRRLILLNFFRAQAETLQRDLNAPSVIYAIEEPETSQHPDNQKMLLQALIELADQEVCQVIITTHVPGLAGYLPVECLRYIDKAGSGQDRIQRGTEQVYRQVSEDLGVTPDSRVCVLVCVEGPNDVRFLTHVSRTICQQHSNLPSLGDDNRVALFPLGGSTLKQWVEGHYLRDLGRPEVHIYDNDVEKYQEICQQVNGRGDASWATLTGKREMENYLHPDAIRAVYDGIAISPSDYDDVPLIVAQSVHNSDSSSSDWDALPEERIKKKVSRVKKRLNDDGAKMMTYGQIIEIDSEGHIVSWLEKIASYLD